MRTLSDLALRAGHAQDTDEVWLLKLVIDHDDILDGPLRFVNDMQDLVVFPDNIIAEPDLLDWTPALGGTVTERGAYVEIADPNAANTGGVSCSTASLTSGTTYTYALRVKKDAVPKTTRYGLLSMGDTGGTNYTWLHFDTSTGEVQSQTAGTGNVAAGAVENGDSWIFYISRTGATTHVCAAYPSVGAGATLNASWNVALQGSMLAQRPVLFPGVIADRQTYIAFPFMLDLPGEDPDAPTSARLKIDNVDRRIVEAIRGLSSPPTASMEVVLASQPETVEVGFYDLTIRAADYNSMTVEAQMTYEQIFTEPVSFDMTPARFPGLF